MGVTRLSLGVENFDDRDPRAERPRASIAGDLPRLRVRARARLPADQHRSHRRHARRDRRELARAASEKTIELEPDSVTIYQMELPFNTTISGDLLKGTGQFHGAGRQLVDEAALGRRRRSRRSRPPGYHVRQRLHRGQESGADALRLSRSALAGRRHGGPRRRVVRPRQRRPHAEPRHVGDLQRRRRERRRFR